MLRTVGGLQLPLLGWAEGWLASRKPDRKPVVLPSRIPNEEPTTLQQLDLILNKLDLSKAVWATKTPKDRAQILRRCIKTTLQVYKEAAAVAAKAHGSYGYGCGEELFSWTPIMSGLREYAETLEAGGCVAPHAVTVREDGQLVVDVFPLGLESLLFGGMRGEIWVLPGHAATQGALYQRFRTFGPGKGCITLVLGAGNQVSVVVLDILQKLVVDDSVVVCKMNPVNDYLGPYIRQALQPLVDEGFVEFAYGGAQQGEYLCNHKLVSDIHLTGSSATYNAIVWGGEPREGAPPFPKPVSGELGCCTPFLIVPGNWSDVEMQYVVELVLTGKLHNSGHNCLAAEIVITDAAWPQRQQFLDCLQRNADRLAQRAPYYPGSAKRADDFKAKYPNAKSLGQNVDATSTEYPLQPLLFVSHDDVSKCNSEVENWGPVLQEVAITGTNGDASTFLQKAVEYANTRCWGTLSMALFIDPQTQKRHSAAFDQAIAALQYGNITVNSPPTIAFATTKLTWGAFPGHTPQDIKSGNCSVHNTLLLDHPQKSVLYVPWRFHPYPPWSIFHRNLENAAPALMEFIASPSLITLLKAVPPCLVG